MGPKKLSASDSSEKKKRKGLSMETKGEIIDKYERGVKLGDIAREYGRNPSTIGTILKQKEVIKAAKPSMGTTVMSKRRTPIHNEMERLLLVWIKDKGRTGDTLTEMIICEKASSIYNDLVSKAASDEQPTASTSSQEAPPTPPEFRASHGWFDRFKKRTGIHSVVRHGEAASSDQEAAEEFLKKFEEFINQEGYIPQQVFNCDETGLFWKKMPWRTYITSMKDRLTLALCANASGDSKVKPLLVYHSENPRAFKQHKILKERLEVMWRSNPTAWVTRQFFVEWVNLVFAPAVKKFLEENDLPMKCLLIIDNAPAHPSTSWRSSLISNFKKLYTKHMFKQCSDITESTQLTLREFWKNHFDIVAYLKFISLAWREVSRRTLNSAWRKLWPDAVAPRHFEGFEKGEEEEEEGEPQPEVEVEEIVNLGTALGLEVDKKDINDLVHEHQEELSTAELQELEAMQHSSVQKQFSEEEEEAVIPSRTFSAIFRGWPILLIKITLKRILPFVL
ncbi:NLR family CARD domain-containing protein 3 [Sarotherodon galilaeus]